MSSVIMLFGREQSISQFNWVTLCPDFGVLGENINPYKFFFLGEVSGSIVIVFVLH